MLLISAIIIFHNMIWKVHIFSRKCEVIYFWGNGVGIVLLRKVKFPITNSIVFNVCLIIFLRICFKLRKIILKSNYFKEVNFNTK